MKIPARFYALVAVLGILIAVVVLIGGNAGALSSEEPLPPDTSVNLIAYVGLEGEVFTVSPDDAATQRRISPEDGFFTWPTWSPDGNQLAFSGATQTPDGIGQLALYISEVEKGEPEVIYTNEQGMGPILPGMPHYLLWSPDSTQLSFMASVSQGLTLFLHDVTNVDDAEVILRNSPLYASWSGDSRYMLVHAGPDHFLVDTEAETSVGDLTRQSLGYRTPAWQPNENKVALLVQDGSGTQSLVIEDVESQERTLVDVVPAHAAFLWSPDGQSLAVVKSRNPDGYINQSLAIFSPDGTRKSASLEDNIISFFWSPDSSRIAYITLTRTRGLLRLMMLDVNSGDTWPLAEFLPTSDQDTVYTFFDQFAHSHSPWSPDSTALVFAGRLQGEGVSVSFTRQPAPQIYVVGADPNPTITSIASGGLAFWSPR